jgi:pyruvate kinase
MLSGETAVGKYPVAAVKTLAHICRTTEQHLDAAVNEHLHMEVGPEWAERATIARSAAFMLDEIKVKYVVMFSRSGVLARLLSKSRIDVPVLSMTDNRTLAGQLALYYGVISVYAPASATYQGWIETVEKTVLDNGWVVPGDKILLIPPLEVLSKNTSGAIIMHTIV